MRDPLKVFEEVRDWFILSLDEDYSVQKYGDSLKHIENLLSAFSKVYSEYYDWVNKADTAIFWREQYVVADIERKELRIENKKLREKLDNLKEEA